MARYDKYNPYGGGFRAPLAADWASGDLGKPYAVGLNSSGQVVKGAGQSGVCGVLVLTKAYKAGTVVDVMTDGEIIEFAPTATTPGAGYGAAGTSYFANTSTGVISTTGTAGAHKVGFTAEASRLIVHAADDVVPATV